MYGPAVVKVLIIVMSADATAVPPLPVLSVLLFGFGSKSWPLTVALLSNGPAALMVAVTLIVRGWLTSSAGMIVHGSEVQPPLTLTIVRFVVVSVSCTFTAGEGPLFKATSV